MVDFAVSCLCHYLFLSHSTQLKREITKSCDYHSPVQPLPREQKFNKKKNIESHSGETRVMIVDFVDKPGIETLINIHSLEKSRNGNPQTS